MTCSVIGCVTARFRANEMVSAVPTTTTTSAITKIGLRMGSSLP